MKKIIAVLLITVVVISCSKKKEEEKSSPDTQTSASASSYTITDFYFKLPLYNGGEIDLKDFAGKPVLVMFFTENCPYCQKAAPFINKISDKYSSKIEVVGISVKANSESAKEFAKQFNLKFKVAYNGMEIAKKYGISGVPFIYLLNKDHTLNKVWAGYDASYESSIDESIAKII